MCFNSSSLLETIFDDSTIKKIKNKNHRTHSLGSTINHIGSVQALVNLT